MTLERYDGICGEFCSEKWPLRSIQRGYAILALIIQFLLPFLTMIFCYTTIFSRLRERANSKLRKLNERSQLLSIKTDAVDEKSKRTHKKASPQQSVDDNQIAMLLNQQRRTTSILASMVTVFGMAWFPHNIVTLMMEYDEEIFATSDTNYTYLVTTIAHWYALSITINLF
jgi:neuropeptide Y receptor